MPPLLEESLILCPRDSKTVPETHAQQQETDARLVERTGVTAGVRLRGPGRDTCGCRTRPPVPNAPARATASGRDRVVVRRALVHPRQMASLPQRITTFSKRILLEDDKYTQNLYLRLVLTSCCNEDDRRRRRGSSRPRRQSRDLAGLINEG